MKAKQNGTKVITGKVRASYAHIFEPHSMQEGQDAKYSVSLIIPKSETSTINAIEKQLMKQLKMVKRLSLAVRYPET